MGKLRTLPPLDIENLVVTEVIHRPKCALCKSEGAASGVSLQCNQVNIPEAHDAGMFGMFRYMNLCADCLQSFADAVHTWRASRLQ